MINGDVIAFGDPAVTGKPIINVTISNATDQQRLIPIYSMDSDPLAGMALLWNSRLTIDVIPDGMVTISPLPS